MPEFHPVAPWVEDPVRLRPEREVEAPTLHARHAAVYAGRSVVFCECELGGEDERGRCEDGCLHESPTRHALEVHRDSLGESARFGVSLFTCRVVLSRYTFGYPLNILTSPVLLTPRQQEVLRLIADGLTDKAIAATLEVSEPTVKKYVHQLLERFGVENRTALIRPAIKQGLID